jgi:hypothetical protein
MEKGKKSISHNDRQGYKTSIRPLADYETPPHLKEVFYDYFTRTVAEYYDDERQYPGVTATDDYIRLDGIKTALPGMISTPGDVGHQEYLWRNEYFDEWSEELQQLIEDMKNTGHSPYFIVGNNSIEASLLNPSGGYLGERKILPSGYALPLTYAGRHNALLISPKDMPPQRHYCPSDQLYVGSVDTGEVVSMYSLAFNSVHQEGRLKLKVSG